MSKRMLRAGLRHKHAGIDSAEFFKSIDESGGWPIGYEYIGFEHTDERDAGFCNSSYNDGWWTVVASADDYYLWKLSPSALQRIADAVRDSIRLPAVNAQAIYIKAWRGGKAATSKTTGEAA